VSLQNKNIPRKDSRFPAKARERLDPNTSPQVTTLGNLDLLTLPTTALLGTPRYPGISLLRAYGQAAHWRNAGRYVVSGFYSPVEKECLRILP